MKQQIIKYLKEIEERREIEILFACETGSRAWGFPSPDSDYDVRIIYKHKLDWYLKLSESRDSIDLMLDDNLIDISGWDLRKSLRLMKKSNGAMLERIQSPIIYYQQPGFIEEVNDLAKDCFSPVATMFHYLGMGVKAFDDVSAEPKFKLKRMFYALRASMACFWILEKGTIVPIDFRIMVKELNLDEKLKQRIFELIAYKSTMNESEFHSGEELIFEFMQKTIDRAKEEGNQLSGGNMDSAKLNNYFVSKLT